MDFKYKNIAVSGKIAVGTTTLAKNLKKALGWKHINAGDIQREYDRKHHINENKQGALARPDDHERQIDEMTKNILMKEPHIIYEAWLAGFMARNIPHTLKILVYCSENAVRIDRIMNRNKVTLEEAKEWLKTRELENIQKWEKLYGNYDFWNSKYFDIVIDTYKSGPMQTLGTVLDILGYQHS